MNTHLRRMAPGCSACGIDDAPIVGFVPNSPYGATAETCTLCGATRMNGKVLGRPTRRPAHETIARARKAWEAACSCHMKHDAEFYALPCDHDILLAAGLDGDDPAGHFDGVAVSPFDLDLPDAEVPA